MHVLMGGELNTAHLPLSVSSSSQTTSMKALAILALVTTGLTLSSCVCKDGKCMFGKKKADACCTAKKTDACCSSGTAAKKTAGSCCH